MCLILIAYQCHPRYPLVLLANRDEFHQRPTAPLDWWPEHPRLLAGRDLAQGGTWMGVTRTGRLAAITNYRDPAAVRPEAPSRGALVTDYLLGTMSPADYLHRIRSRANGYNGFNLIVGDTETLWWYSNRAPDAMRPLQPGVSGLSNHLLDTPWPKVAQGKAALVDLLNRCTEVSEEACFELLQRREIAPDAQLPRTGVDPSWERLLSPIFIATETYGTRSSTVLLIDAHHRITCTERTWQLGQSVPAAAETRQYAFQIEPASR
ncbi:NRDE family protein [Desulfatitalea alkaliphila]|uniref:NRDE family protein n=1 Tax=Desulfatitalea alkaliphila TaxID=2929485 RepID=A0AA41R2Z5_9BACT|nr:NRDE family protein [Desulfatitalea alkaliphila]MCJ8500781.1 NRDE family protein [Desulfatitalea alkaliphila]